MSNELKRFEDKYTPEPNTGCWIWTGSEIPAGYGNMFFRGKVALAHRVSHELLVGPVGDKDVCHKCDNKFCVNPGHLFLGTPTDNMQDMLKKGRGNKPSGSRHGMSKVTAEMAAKIKLERGPSRKIAKKYGICKTSVLRVMRGEHWTNQ